MAASPAAQLRDMWSKLGGSAPGRWLFSRAFGYMVPYTGSVGAMVEELRPGYARLTLNDRRGVRNHLRSIHAVALTNLAEATSGLAMNVGLPDNARAIVVKLSITFVKKARGKLTSECNAGIPDISHEHETTVTAAIKDEAGDVVAIASVVWRVGPDPKSAKPEIAANPQPEAVSAQNS